MSPKKKPVKKLKKRKLEERIAPGMIGGGVVDPGMMEVVDGEPMDTQTDTGAGDVEETTNESEYLDDNPDDGHYEEEKAETSQMEVDDLEDEKQSDELEQETDEFQDIHADEAPGDFTEQNHTWQEPDWVSANADGSVQVQLPDGVEVDNGIANFPADVANESLPLPEGVEVQTDGSVNVALPEGTQYLQDSGQVILPQDSYPVDQIPQDFQPFENPDGSVTCNLPQDGCEYNPDTNTLNIDNHTANEVSPSYMEFNDDGSIGIELPEGTEVADDGSFEMSHYESGHYDHPAPEFVDEIEWANENPDGSVMFEPPEGVEVDGGIMEVPHDSLSELPIPEDMSINPDGSMDIGLPEGTEYNTEANALVFPEGEFHMDEAPQGVDCHVNPDGTTSLCLPEGSQYDADTNSVHLDNYWANEITPDSVNISPEGALQVELPEGTEYYEDGSFNIPADEAHFLENDCPDHVHDAEFSYANGDGSYTMTPPDGFEVDTTAGEVSIPYEHYQELPLPDEIQFNNDGTMNVSLPEGTEYNPDYNSLTFPQGEMNFYDVPAEVNPVLNPDGSVTAYLQDGMEYNEAQGEVHCDNYWTNELTPEAMEVSESGEIKIDLPQDCEYHDDGSLTIPEHNADFLADPAPDYVTNGPEWVGENPDGSVTFDMTGEHSEHVQIDSEGNTAVCDGEFIQEHFDNYIPEEVTFNADGTMDISLPEGTQYHEATHSLQFSPGEMHLNEVPQELNAHMNPDGGVTVNLQDGIDYNPETGSVHLDNYWTNEITPDSVEILEDGKFEVQLPEDTHHFDDGSFMVPEYSADFIENPAPEWISQGPDWVDGNPDGSVAVHYQADFGDSFQIDSEANHAQMDTEFCHEHFDNYIPEEVHFNSDGTMTVDLPQGTTFDADAGALTFPAGEVHLDEIPEDLHANLNEDGSVTLQMQHGMEFDAANNNMHFDNYWTNEITPDHVTVSPSGNIDIAFPDGTQHFDDGSFVIPESQVDFMDNPAPEYVLEGPDWVSESPSGGVMIDLPNEFENHGMIDPEAGTMTMDYEFTTEHFESYMEDDFALHPDGTSHVNMVEGTLHDIEANTLTFPAGAENLNDIPQEVNPTLNEDGSITVQLQPGMEYDAEANSVNLDNHWTNEFTPDPIEITEDGHVKVDLPSETHFHEDGSFHIPEDHADFMEHPEPDYCHDGPDWVSENPDGSISIEFPESVEVDSQAGTATFPIEMIEEFHHDETMTFNPDGTMDIQGPEGLQYNADLNSITFPAGEMYPSDVPENFQFEINNDSSVTLMLPDDGGVSYDPNVNTIHFSNEALNSFSPEPIQFTEDGSCVLTLPEGTEFYENGAVIPEGSANFMDEGQNNDYQPQEHEQYEYQSKAG